MQHIKTYMSKVEQIIRNKQSVKPKKKTDASPTDDGNKDIRVIAAIVEGIRASREEMLNAKK